MQIIGVIERPRFEAHRYEDPGQPEEWRVSAVPRRSLQAGISEAARRAQSRICHIYWEELATSQFRFFPCRSRGAASAHIPLPPPEERNPTMDAT